MNGNTPLVYIIILNWNGSEDTIECLNSVRNNDYPNFKIVIVDNGSDKDNLDKLKSWCKTWFSYVLTYTREQAEEGGISTSEDLLNIFQSKDKLILIENNENLGFAAGNNVAIRYALKKNGTYVFLLNNDTEVTPDFLSVMMSYFEKNPALGAVIPQIRYYNNKNYIWNCGGKIFCGFRKYYFDGVNISKLPGIKKLTISFATGCALLFKPLEVGPLTEKYFFGEEDFEFAYRMKKMKKQMICVLDAVIYHKVGRSISLRRGKNDTGVMLVYYLNRFLNMKEQFNYVFSWNLWRFLYSGYILIILLRRIPGRNIYRFMIKLWQKSSTLARVDKAEFEKVIDWN